MASVARRGPGLVRALILGLGLGLLALGPGLKRGFLLSYDMVFVPREPFSAAMSGAAGDVPRAMPSDAVVAALSRVVPADLLQKLILLSIFVLACSGVAALLGRAPWLARLAAGAYYAWNPFVAERLLIGQWALLLGYAGLPWVLRSVLQRPVLARPLSARPVLARLLGARPGLTRPALARSEAWWRGAGRLGLALVPAAVGGFAAMTVTALVAVPAAACARPGATGRLRAADTSEPTDRHRDDSETTDHHEIKGNPETRDHSHRGGETQTPTGSPPGKAAGRAGRWPSLAMVLTLLAVGSLPWLVPALRHPVYADPAGGSLFAARADTPFGAFGSLLALGGTWNAQTVPGGYGGAGSAWWLAIVIVALGGYVLGGGRRRWPGLGLAALAGLALACIGLTAPGLDLLRAATGLWPGFAVLRDGQQFVTPLALAEAVGFGLAVARAIRPAPSDPDPGPAPSDSASRPAPSGSDLGLAPSGSDPGPLPSGPVLGGVRSDSDARLAPSGSASRPAPSGSASRPAPSGSAPRLIIGLAALLAPVLLLPGLAWGAAGRLRPAAYPAGWLATARMINQDRAGGSALLLPWTAYRRPAWNGGRAMLDPWPRLLSRPVIWNDGGLVGTVQLTPDGPEARKLDALIRSGAPLTAALEAAGVRFVIVDAGGSVRSRLPGCTVLTAMPGPGPTAGPAAGPTPAAFQGPAAGPAPGPGAGAGAQSGLVVYQVPVGRNR